MKTKKTNRKCKTIRTWLYKLISSRISPDVNWIQNHIANCPRCRQRIAAVGRVALAFSILKSQPHNLNLLRRANTQAIGVLGHSLRNTRKAKKLKRISPEPKLLERCVKYRSSIVNAAACITILFLMKAGIFSSMDNFQTEGRKAVRQYYVKQVGQDLADEVFSA